jgi:hypothetical protein
MAEGTNYSNTVRAGAFLITGLLLGLVVIVTLQKTSIFASKSRYLVHFGMDEGVAGLDVGSEVRVSGLKVGRVTRIEQKFDDNGDGNGRDDSGIDVHIEIGSNIRVYKDAVVIRTQPLLGNYSWLNFSSLGTPAAGKIEAGGKFDARTSGGLLATLVGPQNAGRADKMFMNLVAFTDSLDDFARVQYPQKVVPLLDDAQITASKLRSDYDTWRVDVTSGLKDARQLISHFREVNVKQIDDLLVSAQKGAVKFADSMDSLDSELTARIPDIRVMLSDLRQASAQIKLATMEVRRSPWKLLYRPTGDELGRENLYESARAFAIASSDLRVAGDTLRATLKDSPERFSSDPKFRDALKTQVLQSVERYEAAQKKLFDVLQADFKGSEMPSADMPTQQPITTPARDVTAPAPAMPAAGAN